MGSMGKRKGRRTRSTSGGRRVNIEEGFPTFQHNQWTFEGEIERLSHLARAINRVKRTPDLHPSKRRAMNAFRIPMTFMALLWLVTFVLGIVSLLRVLT